LKVANTNLQTVINFAKLVRVCPGIISLTAFIQRIFKHKTIVTLKYFTARVITGTRKFDRGLGQILHDQLHWLHVPDRVLFKLAVTVHQCPNGRAPPYLSEHCITVSSADTRRHLRSANRHLLAVPRFRLNTYGRRASSVASPMAWNLLPDFIRAAQTVLGVYIKRTCSRVTSASSALGVHNDYALYKSTHALALSFPAQNAPLQQLLPTVVTPFLSQD